MFPTKAEIKKFQKQVEQYQEYVERKRILRYLKKQRKFGVRVWKPRWLRVKEFKENYLKKHGFPYVNKKKRRKPKIRNKTKNTK